MHTLGGLTAASGLRPGRFLADASGRVALDGTGAAGVAASLRGRSVLISATRQLPAALALLHLDGVAARLVLCPPDLPAAHLPGVIADAGVDAVMSDGTGPAGEAADGLPRFACPVLPPAGPAPAPLAATEWLLLTSGTTGRPKLVAHTLASLSGPLDDGLAVAPEAVWSTFYDIRRYGGLQILLRALLGGGAMVLSQADEKVAAFLARAGAAGVTHISGTPSHWRRALMSGKAPGFAPRYVRLSGEVADQAILNSLAAAFPGAGIAHAFASTEAGVAFDVRDGLAGFPASMVGAPGAKAELRVIDGTLRIRSARTARCYLGGAGALADADGFVDTGDMVELRGDRYHFTGRREGVINVGGQKVHPEEVEAVLHQHPQVRMARVRGRASPITGALVTADVVLHTPAEPEAFADLREEILALCRGSLAAHKVPTVLRAVATLDVGASGKLLRHA
jgi:acyl-coenzyme A synthetase/AMP-(fatty) acid ligase